MELLTSVFRQLLSMSLTALPVMAVVLAARFLLRKAPKKFSYLLWAVVAFRLVCPVSFSTPVGLVEPEAIERRMETAGWSGSVESPVWSISEPAENDAPVIGAGWEPGSGGERHDAVVTPAGISEPDAAPGNLLLSAAAVTWLLGTAAVLAYGIASYCRLRRRVAQAVREEGNVWACDGIPTPFVLGFFQPRVYIPFRLPQEARAYVLAHERYHIRRLDHWVKLLGYLILAVYWWNPSVWLCWVLCCRDMEMSCDEAVLAKLGDGVKAGYSMSLVSFALDRRAPMALAFGEHDAARRVKNVLNWKRARPAVVFLAVAAVVLVAAVCGTDAERDSWMEAKHTGSAVAFTCEMKEPIRSWAIYEDIYENGELISSIPRLSDSFRGDDGASSRELRGSLSIPPVYETDNGINGDLTVHFSATGGVTWGLTLPKEHYTGMGSILGDGSGQAGRWKLEDDGSVVLYTVMFSTQPNGAIQVGGTENMWISDNDTVLQYRFVTSTLSLKELTADSSLARTLFDLRTDSVKDTEAVEAILTALGMDVAYTLEPFEGREDILLIRCAEEPGINMSSVDALLRALVGDVRQVGHAYLRPDGNAVYVNTYVNADRDWLEDAAQSMGYRNIKEMGKTAAGIQALLDYLGWEEQTGPTVDLPNRTAQELYALRTDSTGKRSDVEKMLEVLNTDALGTYTVEWVDVETVRVRFGSLFVSRDELQSGMQSRAALIMAVGGEVAQVRWSGEGSGSWLAQYYRAGADYIAESLGYQDVARMGSTVEGIQTLLDYLGWEEQADSLDILARTLYAAKGDPEALLTAMETAEEPLGRYAIQNSAGNYLSLLFYDSPVAPEKRSTLMWRYSMVLLALLDDYAATTWNWIDDGVQTLPQNDGLWNTDTWLHAHGLAGTIRDYGTSPEAVRTLLGALYPQSGGGAPVSELGSSLSALRGMTPVLAQVIPERLMGGADWALTDDGILELSGKWPLRYYADSGEGRMSDASCLLLALLPEEVWAIRWVADGRPVEFSYMAEDDSNRNLFIEDTAFAWTEHRSGSGLYVRSCGQTAAGMTMLLDQLGIDEGDLPLMTAEPFTDILGYDGFISREYQNYSGGTDWSRRTYYAVTEDGTFPIAESFGWDEPQDYAVDLDGDGQEELVCGVTFNADGVKRVYVYQRRGDKIWQSSVTAEGLPGYTNTAGIGSDWEEYDPEEKLFRIHYHVEGQEDYAVAEVRGMSQLEEFYPYP